MKRVWIIAVVILGTTLSLSAQVASDMLEKAISSVVTVAVYKTEDLKTAYGFRSEDLKVSDQAYEKALDLAGVLINGSGFVILHNGKKYVITNAHVIEDASRESGSVYIFSINRKKYEVRVVGGDSFYDIAVLEFVDEPGDEVTTIEFREDEPRIGEKVYAVGNPLGDFPYSISDGIISAKNRVRQGTTGKFGYLQTTATIIWGNSGGPLVTERGEVTGINSYIQFAVGPGGIEVWQSQINFALEPALSVRLVDEIIATNGHVVRGFLGVEISQDYELYINIYGEYFPVALEEAPVLRNVMKGSPAYLALKNYIGTKIKSINGVEVRNVEEALGELEKVRPGKTVTFQFEAEVSSIEAKVTATELGDKELEMIARSVLDQNLDIEMDYNSPQLAFKVFENKFHVYNADGRFIPAQKSDKLKMTILAAGITGSGGDNVWKTVTLADFGAALKLSGLEGIIDMYVVNEDDPLQTIEVYRQNLSGDEYIKRTTLWY